MRTTNVERREQVKRARVLPFAVILGACAPGSESVAELPGDPIDPGEVVDVSVAMDGSRRGFASAEHAWQSAADATRAWDHAIIARSESGDRIAIHVRASMTPGTVSCGGAHGSIRIVKEPATDTSPFWVAYDECTITVTRAGVKAGDLVEGSFAARVTSADRARPAPELMLRDGVFRVRVGLDMPPPPP